MIFNLRKLRVLLRPGATDMRKAVNGLSSIVQENMKQDPFSGILYLFCNRQRKLLKCLYWDKTGFWLSQKRLEKEKFPWVDDERDAMGLTGEQLQMLLSGIDFFKAHKELFYKKVI